MLLPKKGGLGAEAAKKGSSGDRSPRPSARAEKAPPTGSTFASSANSSFGNTDRTIPSDEDMAESYYGTEKFEVISSDGSDDDGVLDSSDATGGDRDEMIAAMNKVLQTNFTKEEKARVIEDRPLVPTTDMLKQRHQALKADAIKQLGAETYEKVYKYLRQVRSGGKGTKEAEIVAKLGDIAGKKKVDACFIVEQLVMSEIMSAKK
eukprot:Opistho-2@46546